MKTKTMLGMALLGLAVMAAQPPDAKKAQGLMQEAQAKETIGGDLKGAIELYRQAARSAGGDRALAARALLQVAACQEKLGAAEAKKTYEEIVRSYADQRDAVAVARQKLGVAGGGELVARKVWDGPDFGPAGGVSPDGRYWAYTGQNDYKPRLFDLASGERKVLYDGDSARPVFSADGKKIAFGVTKGDGYELAVKTVDGDGPAVVKQLEFRVWAPLSWFPDGERLLIMAMKDSQRMEQVVASVHIGTGAIEEIGRISQGELLNDMRGLVSPDGKYVVFDKKHADGAQDRDVFVAAATGGAARALIADPSEDTPLAFTPDGRHLLFQSNRGLKPGLYMIRFAEGQAAGEPQLVSATLTVDRGGSFDRKGNFYHWAQTGGESQQFVAEFDAVTGKGTGPRRVPMSRGAGEIPWASWTPNGKEMVFHRFGAGRAIEVAIANVETGRESKVLQTSLPTAYGAFLRPDGTTVLNIPGKGTGEVNWEMGTVAFGEITEGKSEGSVCGGPTVMTSTTRGKGIRITDFATNRGWWLLGRPDLPNTSTFASATPDCRHVVYLPREGAKEIVHVDLSTGQSRELVRVPDGYTAINFPRLSPDGRRVVFIATKSGGRRRELWSVPLSGGAAAPTGIELVNMRNPRFSPDGKRLLLSGGQYNFEAYKVENLLPASLRAGK